MIRKKGKTNGLPSLDGNVAGEKAMDLEVRPGGLLVQKRSETNRNFAPPAMIRVRVQFGSSCHQISINPQATFGELKKMLTGFTGLHHQDQKLIFKGKERDSKEFLDLVRIKDGSKLVLVEDQISRERRYIERRKSARMEKASTLITEIGLEVDMLATQVLELESVVCKGGQVAEKDVISLIDQLMNYLVKLDGMMVDGDLKPKRKMQVKKVQQYVEILDMLKIKNSLPSNNGGDASVQNQLGHTNEQKLESIHEQEPMGFHQRRSNETGLIQEQRQRQNHQMNSNEGSLASIQERKERKTRQMHASSPMVQRQQHHHPQQQNQSSLGHTMSRTVVTMQWETFDSNPGSVPMASTSTSISSSSVAADPKLRWDLL